MNDAARLPRLVVAYTYALLLLASIAVTYLFVSPVVPHVPPRWPLLPLALAIIPTADTPVRFRSARQHEHRFSMEDMLTPALLLLGPLALVPLIHAAGMGVIQVRRSIPTTKAIYNLSAVMIGASSAVAVAVVIAGGPPDTSLRGLAGVIAGSITHEVVTLVLFAGLFRFLDGRSLTATMTDNIGTVIVTTVVNVVVGLLLGVAVIQQGMVAWFALAAAFVIRAGLRQYGEMLTTQAQSFQLHNLTQQLSDIGGLADSTLNEMIASLADTFQGRVVQLVLRYDDTDEMRVFVQGSSRSQLSPALSEVMRSGETVVVNDNHEPLHDAIGFADGMVAPLQAPGLRGALGVFERAGTGSENWHDRDASLLKVLAQQLAVSLRNRDLFREVEEERTALALESGKLRDILETAGDGIALLDRGGVISTWNSAFESVTGIGADEAIGQRFVDLLTLRDIGGRPLPRGPVALRAALAGRSHPRTDVQLKRGEDWRTIDCSFTPVRSGDVAVGVVVVARDVSRERELAAMKTDFVAAVSHELRTPLTPLRGFLQILTQRPGTIDESRLETVYESMSRQVARLEALVGDLLVMADLDRGSTEFSRAATTLGGIVMAAVDVEVRGDQTDRVQLPTEIEIPIETDRQACVRIVRALLSNALKHTDGPVRVDAGEDDDSVWVEVTDKGRGIEAWEREAIFQAFGRVGTHLEWSTQGPGLGLTIARGLAERVGGRLELESEVGSGSTFRLRLPRPQSRMVPASGP